MQHEEWDPPFDVALGAGEGDQRFAPAAAVFALLLGVVVSAPGAKDIAPRLALPWPLLAIALQMGSHQRFVIAFRHFFYVDSPRPRDEAGPGSRRVGRLPPRRRRRLPGVGAGLVHYDERAGKTPSQQLTTVSGLARS